MSVHYRTCPFCEATCGLAIHVDGESITRVEGDKDDAFSKGYVCPKGAAIAELHNDPDRLREPMVRHGDGWRTTSWEEAFEAVEAGLKPVLDTHGRHAVALYLGNPNVHTLAGSIYNRALIKALQSRNLFSASTVDQMPKHLSCGLLFGRATSIPVPDIDRTDYMLILGANPWVSNGSLCSAPDMPGRLKAILKRGGKFVVVDPRRTETARRASEHLAIVPGTDVLFLLAIVHVLAADDRIRPGALDTVIRGLDALIEAVQPFSPEAAAPICGIPAETIRRISHALSDAPTSVVYGRMGLSTQRFGTACSWLVDVINILLGNLDLPGGAMFPTPVIGKHRPNETPGGRGFRWGRVRSRVRDLPEVMNELPVAALAEEIETPGDEQVRALITVAGNPVLSTPNGGRLDGALAGLDFMVCVDPYLNETTRHAHVILPPPSPLERDHCDVAFYGLTVRNVVNFSEPVFAAADDQLPEWEILCRLAAIVGGGGAAVPAAMVDEMVVRQLVGAELRDVASPLHGADEDAILAEIGQYRGPRRVLDFLLRAGPYGDGLGHRNEGPGLSLAQLIQTPHGMDLGALQSRLPGLLRTVDGMIDLFPQDLVAEFERARRLLGSPGQEGFVLVGRRQLRSNNSWLHNLPGLVSGKPRCTLELHPDDARDLGVGDGESICVSSRAGALTVPVTLTDCVRRGVVTLPHGWGHDKEGAQLRVAAAHAGVNINLLTDERELDQLSGTAALNGIRVSLSKV